MLSLFIISVIASEPVNIEIQTIDDKLFKLIVIHNASTYTNVVDEDALDFPILKRHSNILKKVIVANLYKNDFFKYSLDNDKLKVQFDIDLNYDAGSVFLYLLKFIEEHEETYILNRVFYTKEEDEFIYRFNIELATQKEKERYLRLVNGKYCAVGREYLSDQLTPGRSGITIAYLGSPTILTSKLTLGNPYQHVNILRREPLILTVNNGTANLYGNIYAVGRQASYTAINMTYVVNVTLPRIFHTEYLRNIGPTVILNSSMFIPKCTQFCICVDIVSPNKLAINCPIPSDITLYCPINIQFQVQI